MKVSSKHNSCAIRDKEIKNYLLHLETKKIQADETRKQEENIKIVEVDREQSSVETDNMTP